ncbi:hypothetical protein CK203_008824 [Vitis vinifera]|uniref:Uncharacterized protein n=1 Tax=Vitis vinifera TaxID=29760 RepID=A0A438KDK2_VITVI|nr:hypothetical protein CK203_008824 [Vitis vinifera]
MAKEPVRVLVTGAAGINRGFCSIIASVLDVVVVFVIESVVSAECCVF